MSTSKAAFGGWVPPVDLDQIASIPPGFVFQLRHKLRPAHVTYRFGKGMVLGHVLHLQTLDTDRLVVTNQTCREFVQEVTATISDTGVNASNDESGFLSVPGTFFLLGVPSLGFGKLLLIFAQELRIANILTIREYHKRLQAQISTDGGIRPGQSSDVFLYQ